MRARKLVKDENTGKQNIVFFGSYGVNKYHQERAATIGLNFNIKIEELLINPDGSITFDFDVLVKQLTTYNGALRFLFIFRRKDGSSASVHRVISIPNDIKTKVKIDISGVYIGEIINYDKLTISIVHTNFSELINISVDLNLHSKKAAPNYSEKQEAVKDALIPRLSILKGELWYKASYGLPLMEKIRSKGIYDSIIIKYITDYPDVVNIEEFTSTLDKDTHKYTFDCIINTIYGEKINLSNK